MRSCNVLNRRVARMARAKRSDPAASRALYLCLCRYLKRVTVQAVGSTAVTPLTAAAVKPLGFSAAEALLPFPGNSFLGF